MMTERIENELKHGGLLTVEEIGARLGLSAEVVRALAKSGKIPSFRIGRSLRFSPDDLATFIHSCRGPERMA